VVGTPDRLAALESSVRIAPAVVKGTVYMAKERNNQVTLGEWPAGSGLALNKVRKKRPVEADRQPAWRPPHCT